jgi:hypothetical protein
MSVTASAGKGTPARDRTSIIAATAIMMALWAKSPGGAPLSFLWSFIDLLRSSST